MSSAADKYRCVGCVNSMKETGKLCEMHEEKRRARDSERKGRLETGESMVSGVYTVVIPWVEVWVMGEMVEEVMCELGWGEICGVDFVYRGAGMNKSGHTTREHYKVFVHYRETEGMDSSGAKDMLEKGKSAKVWYSEIYYWKVMKSNYVHEDKEKKKIVVRCEF